MRYQAKLIYPVCLLGMTLVLIQGAATRAAIAGQRPRDGSDLTVAVQVSPARLAVLDTVTVAATFANHGATISRCTAILQLIPRHGGLTLTASQGGFPLRRGQRLTVYWEWQTGASLPPGVYTVHVLLASTAQSHRIMARGTALIPLTILPRANGR